MEQKDDYITIDLMQIFHAIWHRLWAVILAAVIGGGILFSYATFFIPPKYEAEAQLYVNNSSFSVGSTEISFSPSELSAAQSLVDTYIVILRSWPVLDKVMDAADVDYSYEELREMLSAAPVNSTEVFSVVVTSTDPVEAQRIANAVVDVLPDAIADIVDGSSVRIVASALLPSGKVSPSITKYTAIGIVIGILIACGIIVLRVLTDTKIHSEDYLESTYNLPVMAVIPNLHKNDKSDYRVSYTSAQK